MKDVLIYHKKYFFFIVNYQKIKQNVRPKHNNYVKKKLKN